MVKTVKYLIFLLLLMTACRPDKPLLLKSCTQLDCGVTLTVQFMGASPKEFNLAAVTPDGMEMSVRCIDGKGVYPEGYFEQNSYAMCRRDGVDFIRFSPDELTLTLNWEGGQVTGTARPVYRIEHPNGAECEPECRIGEVILDLSKPKE